MSERETLRADVHERHPFPQYASHVALVERLAADRHFVYVVCPNGHAYQTVFGAEYPCSTPGCGRSVRVATRWFAETLRAAERGLTWLGDPL